ncbi:MAG: iron uptake porin [Cyanobacteriota bacterium]
MARRDWRQAVIGAAAGVAAPALLGPGLATAADLQLAEIGRYSVNEPLNPGGPFTDLRPSDWSYQALSNLVERYGCGAGYAQGSFKGSRAISRFEAAALLNSCLDRIGERTDSLRRLLQEFSQELAILKGRTDRLDARLEDLKASQFSSTTKLSGQATVVVGANAFGGVASSALQQQARAEEGGTSVNDDLQLELDTSLSGTDLLRIKLRAGNFARSGFGGGAPVGTNQAALFLNQLEIAFQQDCIGSNGLAVDCGDVVGVQRVFYQFPIGKEVTATVGALVRQDDMLAMWPSVYPADTLLDSFTYAGAPGAYNSNLGPGAGLWWKRGNWNLSVHYIAGNGASASDGGIGTVASAQSSTVQLGYASAAFGIVGAYTTSRNVGVASGTPLAVLEASAMNAIGLSGFWQPSSSGWLPSISAGWGMNTYSGPATTINIAVQQSQSWYLGLQWNDVLIGGNKAGFAVGQPTFVTRCGDGCPSGAPQDGQYAWEWWYSFQISDNLTVTPALFYLSNGLGQLSKIETGSNAGSLSNLGGLVKTTFRF